MSDTITKYIRGSCPVSNAGQTVVVEYIVNDINTVSIACEYENECTIIQPCPVKKAALSILG